MPYLIIGHTTETTARLWVRGDRDSKHLRGRAAVSGRSARPSVAVVAREITPQRLTSTASSLVSITSCMRRFLRRPVASAAGSARFVESLPDRPHHSASCSPAAISPLSASTISWRALPRPPGHRWRTRPSISRCRVGRTRASSGCDRLLRVSAQEDVEIDCVAGRLGDRHQAARFAVLRSPFLKLSAVFDSSVLGSHCRPSRSRPARLISRRAAVLAVGDRVRSSSGATALVASIEADDAEVDSRAQEVARRTGNGEAPPRKARGLVLTQADGAFAEGDALSKPGQTRTLGTISKIRRGRAWFEPPSFFIHAGDQIYYDFPKPDRAPDRERVPPRLSRGLVRRRGVVPPARALAALHDTRRPRNRRPVRTGLQASATLMTGSTASATGSEAAVAYREYAHALSSSAAERPAGAGRTGPTGTLRQGDDEVLRPRHADSALQQQGPDDRPGPDGTLARVDAEHATP